MAAILHITAQHPLVVMGNKQVNFENPMGQLPVSALPTPAPLQGFPAYYFYDGSEPQYSFACQFDENGELRLFVVDGNIYDGDGYLIAESYFQNDDTDWPMIGRQPDIVITAIPGSCTRYLLFSGGQTDSGSRVYVLAVIIDLELENPLFTGLSRLGACWPVSELDEEPSLIGFTNLGNFQGELESSLSDLALSFEVEGSASKKGFVHFDLIESEGNGSKQLFFAVENVLCRVEITATGFNSYYEAENIAVGGTRTQFGELEVTWNAPESNYLVALTYYNGSGEVYYPAEVYVNRFSPTFSWLNETMVQVGTAESNLVPRINGLEFSPDGNYLYYTSNLSPYFGWINTQTNATGDLSSVIPVPSQYATTRLEGNRAAAPGQDAIYCYGPGGLSALINPNNPSQATFQATVAVSSSLGNVPEYHDPYTPTVTHFRTFQRQNYNGGQMMSFLQSQGCCYAMLLDDAYGTKTITTAEDGSWSYGNNPFGNSTGPVVILGDLVFEPGTVTYINNMTFEFGPEANVVIKAGARVNLQSSKWTALHCNSTMWPGVNLLGTTNSANSIDQNPLTGGDQGYFYVVNSIIEHAIRGVEVGTMSTNAGGIIRAMSTTFRNNQHDVIFRRYHYVATGGNYVQNKSYFRNCTFVTDAASNNPSLFPLTHVTLNEVDKILFGDCSFMNKTPIGIHNWFQRGTGIMSNKSSFSVDGLNDPWTASPFDPDQTTFYKLRFGIRSYGYNNPLSFYTCKEQEFQFCLYGIVNYNTDNVMIYLNNFTLPDAAGFTSSETVERGIYLTNSTGYTVEQNTFTGFDDWTVDDPYPCAMGIWVDNSGDFANEIRNNDFYEMKLGSYVTNDNQFSSDNVQWGLQLICNTYTNCQTDIYRDELSTMRWIQGGPQQDGLSLNAGNRFSSDFCNGVSSDFIMDPFNNFSITYVCHNDLNAIPDCGGVSIHPDSPGMELLNNDVENDSYSDLDCPNAYAVGGGGQSPGGIAGIVSELNSVRSRLHAAQFNYLQVVDDNQKQSTLDILTEAFPHESQYYRDLLMQRYPLSDEVLRKLIAQAARLSSWHLTEVLLANSPLRREMLAEIERAEILSPFFMQFLYDADAGASLRTLMEFNIMGLATHRDKLIQQIAQSGFTYDSDPDLETDQLIYLNDYMNQIEQQDALVMLRSRASLLASKDDYVGAIAMVTEEARLANYRKILEIQQDVAGDWSLLTAIQIGELWNIYNQPKDFSSSMALAILQEIGEADFEPEPRVPIQYRSLQMGNDNGSRDLPLLGVWPNPASGSAWLHYPIEADDQATIKVYDPQGRLLHAFIPNSSGLVELSLKNYVSGNYVVQLIAFDLVIESIKLIVVNHQ
jgi:hypothetical protein